jgi:hypothetical protein
VYWNFVAIEGVIKNQLGNHRLKDKDAVCIPLSNFRTNWPTCSKIRFNVLLLKTTATLYFSKVLQCVMNVTGSHSLSWQRNPEIWTRSQVWRNCFPRFHSFRVSKLTPRSRALLEKLTVAQRKLPHILRKHRHHCRVNNPPLNSKNT